MSSRRSFGLRRIGLGSKSCGKPGEHDVESAFEFGGAVVARQHGGQTAQKGELADRQPVQAQPQQVVSLIGVFDDFLEFVKYVAVQEAEQGPVDVQCVRSGEASAGERRETSSSGRSVPRGRSASGVASGRVTSNGTTCGWARASAR